MAMIFCSKCGKQISDKAAACPHCGAPNVAYAQSAPQPVPQAAAPAKKSSAGRIMLIFMLILAVGAAMIGLNYVFNRDKSDSDKDNKSSVQKTTYAVDTIIEDNKDKTPNDVIDNGTLKQPQPPATQPQTEKKCSVHLIVESEDNLIAGTYLVDVKIDDLDDPLFSIQDGQKKSINLTLSPGTHKIIFERNGKTSVNSVATAYINNDCTLSYYIDCWPKTIKVKEK